MPTDDWLIFAYVMIFSSIIFCGILPMLFRLLNVRRRFHRYDLERQAIEYSCPHAFLTLQSIYSDVQIDISEMDTHDFHPMNSTEEPIVYSQLAFIDDDTSI